MTRPDRLGPAAVEAWLASHRQWRLEAGHLVRDLATVDYPGSVRLLEAQVSLAEGLDHHPVVVLGYRTLRFELWTHDRGGVTSLDVAYAEGLDQIVERDFADVVVPS